VPTKPKNNPDYCCKFCKIFTVITLVVTIPIPPGTPPTRSSRVNIPTLDPVLVTAIATVIISAIAGTAAVLIIRTALTDTHDDNRAHIITAVADLIRAIRGR
jgi:hypothetical protein